MAGITELPEVRKKGALAIGSRSPEASGNIHSSLLMLIVRMLLYGKFPIWRLTWEAGTWIKMPDMTPTTLSRNELGPRHKASSPPTIILVLCPSQGRRQQHAEEHQTREQRGLHDVDLEGLETLFLPSQLLLESKYIS